MGIPHDTFVSRLHNPGSLGDSWFETRSSILSALKIDWFRLSDGHSACAPALVIPENSLLGEYYWPGEA